MKSVLSGFGLLLARLAQSGRESHRAGGFESIEMSQWTSWNGSGFR